MSRGDLDDANSALQLTPPILLRAQNEECVIKTIRSDENDFWGKEALELAYPDDLQYRGERRWDVQLSAENCGLFVTMLI